MMLPSQANQPERVSTRILSRKIRVWQERLSAFDLESKREAVERAREALEAEKRRLDRLTADAEEAQARAAELNNQVQQKVWRVLKEAVV